MQSIRIYVIRCSTSHSHVALLYSTVKSLLTGEPLALTVSTEGSVIRTAAVSPGLVPVLRHLANDNVHVSRGGGVHMSVVPKQVPCPRYSTMNLPALLRSGLSEYHTDSNSTYQLARSTEAQCHCVCIYLERGACR